MDIISLRSVGLFEIPDSFRGILRISPNNGIDDASELLISGNPVSLSDSQGNMLPIIFKAKTFKTVVVDRDEVEKNVINIIHEYSSLFVSKSLNVKSTLYIEPDINKVPLLFVNDGKSLGYPIEAPDDDRYFNYNNILNKPEGISVDDFINSSTKPSDDIYSEKNNSEFITINNERITRYIRYKDGDTYKTESVPELNKRTYVLGSCPGHTYRRTNTTNNVHDLSDEHKYPTGIHTQLSFISLDNLVWNNIEAITSGIYRSGIGRYKDLNQLGYFSEDNNTQNNLYKFLFNSSFGGDVTASDNYFKKILDKSPIMGVPVQSGTIHYNAIPPKHYFFHLARRYSDDKRAQFVDNSQSSSDGRLTYADVLSSNIMNNITRQYVLCDGKQMTKDYPGIDSELLKVNWSDTHIAISKSTGDESGTEIVTPPLFECDQLSLRFLRGLNWLRSDTNDTNPAILDNNAVLEMNDNSGDKKTKLIPNDKVYRIINKAGDKANHPKDIHKVGMHYVHYDNRLQKQYNHTHLLFSSRNNELLKDDTLANEKNIFRGSYSSSEVPKDKNNWEKYIKGEIDTFRGSHILKTYGGFKHQMISDSTTDKIGKLNDPKEMRILRDTPIAVEGGSTDIFYSLYACIRYGKRKLGKCSNHRTSCQGPVYIRDGRYRLACAPEDANYNWRFLTSLPVENKYGKTNVMIPEYSIVTYNGENSNKFDKFIDDSIASPPAINFIPLMKI